MTKSADILVPDPLAQILLDMERCIEAGLYYPALLIALTMPEICASLDLNPDVFIKEKHYVKFIETYCEDLGLDGLSCYRLRGGVVHRGNAAGHHLYDSTHVIFTTPQSQAVFHGFSMTNIFGSEQADMFDLVEFCSAMRNAVLKWYVANGENELVKANIPALLSLRPNGVAPWVVGTPVIASGV